MFVFYWPFILWLDCLLADTNDEWISMENFYGGGNVDFSVVFRRKTSQREKHRYEPFFILCTGEILILKIWKYFMDSFCEFREDFVKHFIKYIFKKPKICVTISRI